MPVGTAVLAIASKHLARSYLANVFNPAALALVAAAILFGSGQSWWGALPDRPPLTLGILLGLGMVMASRVHKLPMVLAFLGTYLFLFTITAFIVEPAEVAEIFRAPDLNAALFFAVFMLDDPPTSPVRPVDQLQFGVIVAWVSYLVFVRLGAVYYLLAGLLVGNLWEAWRRWIERRDSRGAR